MFFGKDDKFDLAEKVAISDTLKTIAENKATETANTGIEQIQTALEAKANEFNALKQSIEQLKTELEEQFKE